MPGVQKLQPRLHPASFKGERDAGDAPLRPAQPLFLQHHDGGDPGSDRSRNLSGIQKKEACRDSGTMMNNQRKWKISLEESVFFVYDNYIVSEEEPAFIRISTKQEEIG